MLSKHSNPQMPTPLGFEAMNHNTDIYIFRTGLASTAVGRGTLLPICIFELRSYRQPLTTITSAYHDSAATPLVTLPAAESMPTVRQPSFGLSSCIVHRLQARSRASTYRAPVLHKVDYRQRSPARSHLNRLDVDRQPVPACKRACAPARPQAARVPPLPRVPQTAHPRKGAVHEDLLAAPCKHDLEANCQVRAVVPPSSSGHH